MTRALLILMVVCQLLIAPIASSHMHASRAATPTASAHADRATHAVPAAQSADTKAHSQHIDHRCCEPGGHCSPSIVQLNITRLITPRLARAPDVVRVALLPRGSSLTPYRPPSHSV